MKIQKLVLTGDDKSTTMSMEKILTIPIKPGIPAGTRIVFSEKGDQRPTKIPGKSFRIASSSSSNLQPVIMLVVCRAL